MFGGTRRAGPGGAIKGRLIIAAIIAIFSIVSYFGSRSVNEVTNEVQHVSITPEQEVALGLQAAPQMAQQHGGLHPDERVQARIDQIGQDLITKGIGKETKYKFDFHVLADAETVNAFALPGGQIFMTMGLLKRLETDAQVAGVLGHEIGHVVGRHGAEHMAKARLTQGLTGAAVIASYDPNNPSSRGTAAVAAMVGQLVNMKYGRNDEIESDRFGVRYMANAGYNPNQMIRVMEVLRDASKSRGGAPPEFFSTHPNPENRIGLIQEAIKAEFPNGLPDGLKD